MRRLLLPVLVIPLFASGGTLSAGLAEEASPPAPRPPVYVSSFDGYRRFADQPVDSWAAANARVRQIGGWRAYARESQTPIAPEPTSADTKSSSDGHASHHR
jgi:hypothetical protein